MNELDKVLDKDEKVLWGGKPKFGPFFLSGILALALMGLFVLLFSLGGFIEVIESGHFRFLFFLPQFWIMIAGIFVFPIYVLLAYRHAYFAITNKRIISQSGVVGRDFEIVDFRNITNAEVRVGIINKMFGNTSGSIFFFTASDKYYSFDHLENPYEVFKFFKKVAGVGKGRN